MKLIAHGGFPAKYPENTLESYVQASKFNPYAIEMDVVEHPETGELICYHPAGVSSKAGIFSTEVVVEQIAAGRVFPLVKDVIKKIPSDIKILLDFKEQTEEVFSNLVNDNDIDNNRVIIGARNLKFYSFLKNLNNELSILALFADPDDYKELAKEGGKYFRIWDKDVNQERIDVIHESGLEVWVTPGKKRTETQPRTAGEASKEKLSQFVELGVDAVLVNDIESSSEYLDK